MFLRRAAILILILTVLLAGIAGFVAWKKSGRLFSDPSMPRGDSAYEQVFAPSARSGPSASAFAHIALERTASQIKISSPYSTNPASQPYPKLKLHRGPATTEMNIEAGTISLAAIACGYVVPRTNFDYSIEITPRLYGPDLRPLSQVQLTNLFPEWERKLEFRGTFPAVRFVFAHTNLSEFKLVSYQIFDNRTKQSLNSGGSSSYSERGFWFGSDLQLWHQTPIEIVATVATGPVEVYFLNPEEHAELDLSGIRLKFIEAVDGSGGWRASSDSRTNLTIVDLPATPPAEPRTTALFLVSPSAGGLPVDIDLLGANDAPLPGYSTSTSRELLNVSIRARAGEIKRIRVRFYPNVHRLVLTLPEVPGLPEENRGVQNLFDVRIPYIRFQSEWEFQASLGYLIAMDIPTVPLTYPNNYFPFLASNVTARALFKEFESHLSNPTQYLQVDSAANKVELARSPITAALERLKSVLPR